MLGLLKNGVVTSAEKERSFRGGESYYILIKDYDHKIIQSKTNNMHQEKKSIEERR